MALPMRNHVNVLLAAALCACAAGLVGSVGCSSSSQPKGISNYVKAVQAYQSGNREQAIANAVAATRANPDLIMARLMLGDLYRESGEYNNAVGQYEVLVK